MRKMTYLAVLNNSSNPDDVYTVTFPDVPGTVSEGKGIDQALKNGAEALGLMLYDMDDLPEASDIDEVREKNREAVVRLVAVDLEETCKAVREIV